MLPPHHRRPSPTVFIALAAATLLAACQTAQRQGQEIPPYGFPTVATEWHDDVLVTYTGTLRLGRPCSVLRRDDGTEVAIQGKPFPLRLGDRVTISGPTALWSLCQTLETIRADKVNVMSSAFVVTVAPAGTVVTVQPLPAAGY